MRDLGITDRKLTLADDDTNLYASFKELDEGDGVSLNSARAVRGRGRGLSCDQVPSSKASCHGFLPDIVVIVWPLYYVAPISEPHWSVLALLHSGCVHICPSAAYMGVNNSVIVPLKAARVFHL